MTLEYPLEITLKQVDIYKRNANDVTLKRFRDIEIRVGNTRVPKDLREPITFNDYCDSMTTGNTDNTKIFTCNKPYPKGKYISVQMVKPPQNVLEIAEVVTYFEE